MADMPFLTYQLSVEEAMRNAGRLIQEGGAAAVKIEGGRQIVDTARRLVDIGVPVMGHLGLTPQSVHQLGGFRPQARDSEAAERLVTFLTESRTQILDPKDQLAHCISLMRKYVDTPMDFGDATLVWAAHAVRVYDICTIDIRGFSIFRAASGKRFKLVLQ